MTAAVPGAATAALGAACVGLFGGAPARKGAAAAPPAPAPVPCLSGPVVAPAAAAAGPLRPAGSTPCSARGFSRPAAAADPDAAALAVSTAVVAAPAAFPPAMPPPGAPSSFPEGDGPAAALVCPAGPWACVPKDAPYAEAAAVAVAGTSRFDGPTAAAAAAAPAGCDVPPVAPDLGAGAGAGAEAPQRFRRSGAATGPGGAAAPPPPVPAAPGLPSLARPLRGSLLRAWPKPWELGGWAPPPGSGLPGALPPPLGAGCLPRSSLPPPGARSPDGDRRRALPRLRLRLRLRVHIATGRSSRSSSSSPADSTPAPPRPRSKGPKLRPRLRLRLRVR